MFETFRNAWKIEDLRKKLLYTLLVIVIFRLGCAVLSNTGAEAVGLVFEGEKRRA